MKRFHQFTLAVAVMLQLAMGAYALTGCADKAEVTRIYEYHKATPKPKPVVSTTSSVQHATLTTQKQQLDGIRKAHEFTAFDEYEHDDAQLKNGHRDAVGSSEFDYWSADKYAKIVKLREAIEAGGVGLAKSLGYTIVHVDCDDTMVMLYQALVDMGYPRDQLYFNYYLVPPSKMAGISGKQFGGHAVLTMDVEGMKPISMEDMFPDYRRNGVYSGKLWRYVAEIEGAGENYYCVGQHRMDYDIRTHWYFIDYEGYNMFSEGIMSYDEVIKSSKYVAHIKYLKRTYHRADFE